MWLETFEASKYAPAVALKVHVSVFDSPRFSSWAAIAVAVMLLCAAALGPMFGDLASFRTLQLGWVAVVALAWWRHPRALAASLSKPSFGVFSAAVWLWCLACGATHFLALEINGVDFSIFEWMLGSTHQGHVGYSRIYEVNHFGVHSTFLMLLLVPIHALVPSPWVLLVTGATLVWAGLYPLRRLVRWAHGGPHGGLELLTMVAWVSNPWFGKLLNAGFRIEALLPVLTLWFLVGWVERRLWVWGLAMVGLWFSKEDSCLFLASFALVAGLKERSRWRESAWVVTTSAVWLVVYVRLIQPTLLGHAPMYLGFWSDFGATVPEIVSGMVRRPTEVLRRLITSGWWRVALPALLVPLGSVRAVGGMAATVFLLGTATYDQMHDFAAYYPVPLVAFMLLGALDVWRSEANAWVRAAVVLSLLLFPLFWSGYGRAVAFDSQRLAGMAAARAFVANDAHVCAQTALFPHLGVDSRLIPLLDLGPCLDPPDVTLVLNPTLGTWPFPREEFKRWVAEWETKREVTVFPGGFRVLRPKSQRPPALNEEH